MKPEAKGNHGSQEPMPICFTEIHSALGALTVVGLVAGNMPKAAHLAHLV